MAGADFDSYAAEFDEPGAPSGGRAPRDFDSYAADLDKPAAVPGEMEIGEIDTAPDPNNANAQGETHVQALELPEETITAEAPDEPVEWVDGLLSLAEGRGQGVFGRVGQKMGDILGPDLPPGTRREGGGVLDQLPHTAGNEALQALGRAETGIPAMIAAGPTKAGQAALGAGLGAMNAYGEGGGLGATLMGGATGALTGLLGGAATQGANYLAKPAGAQLTLPGIKAATKGSELLKKFLPDASSITSLGGLVGLAPRAVASGVVAGATAAPRAVGYGAQALGQTAAAHSGRVAGAVENAFAPAKAHGQDKAYAGTPTMSWAVQSVLTSGTSGLPEDAEQRLTEAVMTGDPSKVVSANFVLSQRYPAYAKRMTDEYEALQKGGE